MLIQAINDSTITLTSYIWQMHVEAWKQVMPFLWLFVAIWFVFFLLRTYGFSAGKTDEEIEEEQRREEIYDGCVDIMEQQYWENLTEGEWKKLQYEAGIEAKKNLEDIKSSASLGATLGVINLFH